MHIPGVSQRFVQRELRAQTRERASRPRVCPGGQVSLGASVRGGAPIRGAFVWTPLRMTMDLLFAMFAVLKQLQSSLVIRLRGLYSRDNGRQADTPGYGVIVL